MSSVSHNSPILADYAARTPGSARRWTEARDVFPSGLTHDGRYFAPHPLYCERAAGSRKWDVDGNEYVDYYGGHGALLLGHAHPATMLAAVGQLTRGTHFAAGHDLEIRWGRLVRELVPSAERVRFTSSGTEASQMALRLARAFTGRPRILRFQGHFHGWHDMTASGVGGQFDGSAAIGIPAEVAATTVLVPPNDIEAVRRVLAARDDVAAAIIEPTGASYGQVPTDGAFVRALREATAAAGVLLVLDEVVTGFRVAPGGAQSVFGVTPDVTILAKVLAGGLPGGAVAGRKDILDALDFEASAAKGREKIAHPGTFNANPVSAAAGIATLEVIRDTDACARACAMAARMREALRAEVTAAGVPWGVYGTFTGFHIFTNPAGLPIDPATFDAAALDPAHLRGKRTDPTVVRLRAAMRVEGVDLSPWPGGLLSAAHTDADLDRTVEAFRRSLARLAAERALP